MDITRVILTNKALKDLKKLPVHIVLKLQNWVDAISTIGWKQIKMVRGYNDEALKGKRQGQRSIRLSKAYRAIYVIKDNGCIEFIEVREVSKHEY